MSDEAPIERARSRDRILLIIVATIMLLVAAVFVWLFTLEPGLGACEDAIKETLKAPATYQRVEVEGSSGDYTITYDAENSFGVPLRGTGSCIVSGGQAQWFEDSHSDGLTP